MTNEHDDTYRKKQSKKHLVQYKRWVHKSWVRHLDKENEQWKKPYKRRREVDEE